MTKQQFLTAADRVEAEDAGDVDEKILEFNIGKQTFQLRVPTPTQIIRLSGKVDGATVRDVQVASMDFLEGLMIGNSFKRFDKLVANGTVTYELLIGGDEANDHGIVDWVVEQVSDGRPPKPSTDSSPSASTGGRRSTGRAPGAGSIPSASQ